MFVPNREMSFLGTAMGLELTQVDYITDAGRLYNHTDRVPDLGYNKMIEEMSIRTPGDMGAEAVRQAMDN